MLNTARIYFSLFGKDFDPNEVSKIIGLKSTSNSEAKNYSTWEFSSEKIESDTIDVYEMSSNLISILSLKTKYIIEMMKKFNLEAKLQVVLEISPNEDIPTPAIGFDTETIKFLSEVNAFVDIDTYKS